MLMRLAVLSDIHSNSIALKACIDYIEQQSVDGLLLLGDYVSDCPNPQETLKLLRYLNKQYKVFMIRGNREQYFLNYKKGLAGDWKYTSYQGSLLYTYERLTENDLDWFASMPETMLLELEGTAPILLVHGSPLYARELMDAGKENTDKYLEQLPIDYMVAGHTHRQFIYKKNGKHLLNPGSVGVAIGVENSAHMAMLTWKQGKWNTELLTIPYDYKKVCEIFKKSSLMKKAKIWPKCILKSISTGVNLGPICAKRSFDLAMEAKEPLENNIVPEKYWEKAAREIGVL